MQSPKRPKLRIQNFAQIADAEIEFGDLTVLVGAQGTGKSLALQWLKTAIDGRQVVEALRDAGQSVEKPSILVDLIFGVGMGSAWSEQSVVTWQGKTISPKAFCSRSGSVKTEKLAPERMFFIPAHRSLLIGDGWALPFQKFDAQTPVVARMFSQNLFDLFNERDEKNLFPRKNLLKKAYRDRIDQAIFHGGTVGIEEDQNHSKKLKLSHGHAHLPFMTWTAGQREFTPLLLGLYHLIPGQKTTKDPNIEWVVIEEPEMGLHPDAITALLLLVLDLLWRGYRIVLSTHSPHVLTAIWMLQRLKELGAKPKMVADAFGIKPATFLKVAEAALAKDFVVYAMEYGKAGTVRARNISSLDPNDEDDSVSGWGGLTGASSTFGNAVRQAVISAGQ
jgi:energy-coupling factor transporter ATP-binding protein EcfA2